MRIRFRTSCSTISSKTTRWKPYCASFLRRQRCVGCASTIRARKSSASITSSVKCRRTSGVMGRADAASRSAHPAVIQSDGDLLDDRHVISRTSASADAAAGRDAKVGLALLLHGGTPAERAIGAARYDFPGAAVVELM